MSIKIYHNNSCSKSRIALAELTKSGEDFEIINYLENVPGVEELKAIVQKLGIRPFQLVRTTEKIYKEKFGNLNLSDEEWIKAMHENPILIQRPILVKGDVAIIGRSEEALDELF
ncbi:arsenate reductase family protein [Nubsella zeaxanthinifaciens]|uniref:arsenate reductase family protein n=1 Tax=Nubsella zeaxanthinifaciens TaxID=392412 RepID=UPI000DE42846|nr:arsenate reductase family protein [Nubsella zeaxanthinifaciens]